MMGFLPLAWYSLGISLFVEILEFQRLLILRLVRSPEHLFLSDKMDIHPWKKAPILQLKISTILYSNSR